jgi:hypothetical protein
MPEPGDPDFFEFLALNNMLMYMSDVEGEDMGKPPHPSEKTEATGGLTALGCALCAAAAIILFIIVASLFD